MNLKMTKLVLAGLILIGTAFLPRGGQALTCCGDCTTRLFACQDACASTDHTCAARCMTRFQSCSKSCGPGGCGS